MADPVWCFSQVVNLRCIGLSHLQRISLVIPPALHLLAAFYLATLSLRRTQIKNSLIFIEAVVFFGLCVGELALHEAATSATSSTSALHTYTVADRAIGALSAVPLVAYAIFLPLFIGSAVLPYLHRHWHTASMHTIVLAIPVLLVLQELASLDGVVYAITTSDTISQTYMDAFARNMSEVFTDVTLGILLVVQLVVTLLCLRLISHISHIHELGGSIPGVTVKAAVMFAAGTSIGAVDAGFGLVPSPIFATILFRRIIEAISRLLIIASLVNQHFSEERNSGSPTLTMHAGIASTRAPQKKARPMRRSGLLGLIGNPRYSTFAHLGGDNVAADLADIRRQQRVTVSYDYINPPVLDVRFSQLEFPQVERALAYAAAVASTSAPSPFSRAIAPLGIPGDNNNASRDRNSKPTSPTISLRANASLYRYRPEYFYPHSSQVAPISQQIVDRPDSPVFGRGSTIDVTASGNRAATTSRLQRPDLTKKNSLRETVDSRSTDLGGQIGDSYSTSGILSQFPETPRTRTSSLFTASRRDSRNRLNERETLEPISLPVREHPFFGGRSRVASAAGRSDPFLDLTPSDGNGNESISSIARIVTVESRGRVVAVGQPSRLGLDGSQNNDRDSPFDFSDHAPSPFDPNGYGAVDSPVPNTTPEPSLPQQNHSDTSQNPTSHRRPDMRHQRIPTAELAPLNVFRERLAERRRERSGNSSTTGEGIPQPSFSSPSPLSSPSPSQPSVPRSRAVSVTHSAAIHTAIATPGIGGERRDTRTFSTAPFVVGPDDISTDLHPPNIPERSHWSETNDETTAAENDDDDSILDPPAMGALSQVNSERTTPSPRMVPAEIHQAERRGSVIFGIAR